MNLIYNFKKALFCFAEHDEGDGIVPNLPV